MVGEGGGTDACLGGRPARAGGGRLINTVTADFQKRNYNQAPLSEPSRGGAGAVRAEPSLPG